MRLNYSLRFNNLLILVGAAFGLLVCVAAFRGGGYLEPKSQGLSEKSFVAHYSNQLVGEPEIIVTPDCVFNRYQLGRWSYLFTNGALVLRSAKPEIHVRKYCLMQRWPMLILGRAAIANQ